MEEFRSFAQMLWWSWQPGLEKLGIINFRGGSPKREEDKETEANWRDGKQEEKGAELNSKQGEPAFQGSTIPWVEKLRQP